MGDIKETICRLCLKDSGQRYPIYGEVGVEKKIALKIETCSPVLMYAEDPLPKVVCYYCVYKLDSAYDFWQTCLESQNSLLSVISTSSDQCAIQYLEFVKRTRTAKREIDDNSFYVSPRCVEQAEDPFKEDPFKEVAKSSIEEFFFEEQIGDDFMPETSVVPINVPSSDEEVEEESDVEILDDFSRKPKETVVLGSESCEKSSSLLNNALKEACKAPIPLPLNQVGQSPLSLNQAGEATTLLLNQASQASTTLPLKADQASTTLSLNQAGQVSTTLPLNEVGQASTSLPLNQACQASTTLSLNQAGQTSTTLPLNQAGQKITSVPLNQGGQTPTALTLNESDEAYEPDHAIKDSTSCTTQKKTSNKVGDNDQASLSNGLIIESVMSMVATQNKDPLFMKSMISAPSCGTNTLSNSEKKEKEINDNAESIADLPSLKAISFTHQVSPSKPTRYNNNSPIQCSQCRAVFQAPISYNHHIAREHGQMRCMFCNQRYKVYRHLMNHVRMCEYKMLNPNTNDMQQEAESNFSCSYSDKYKKLGVGSVPSLVVDTVERTEIYSQSVQAVKKLGTNKVESHVSESVQRSIDNQLKLKRKWDNDSDVSQDTTKDNHGKKSILGTDKLVDMERLAPVAFDCKTCGEVFISTESLEKHNNSEHSKHSCNICGEAFNSYTDLVFHMKKKCKTRSTAGKASEKLTNSSFKSRLPANSRSKQNNEDLSCRKCNERLSTVEALKEHYKQVHSLSGLLVELNQQVYEDNSYVSDRQFKGDTNDKEAKDNSNTTKPAKDNYPHMSVDSEPFFPCNLCNKSFTNELQLVSHLKAHAVLPTAPCIYESRRVQNNQLVLRSGQDTLPNQVSEPKGFLCKICNKRCSTNFSFKKHVEKHVEAREVTCKRCGVVFSNNYNLTKHIINCHSPLIKHN